MSERACGKRPSSSPVITTVSNSRPLALWIVIRVTRARLVHQVGVGLQGDALQEARQRRLVGAPVVLGGHPHHLLQVLDAPLRLERPLAPSASRSPERSSTSSMIRSRGAPGLDALAAGPPAGGARRQRRPLARRQARHLVRAQRHRPSGAGGPRRRPRAWRRSRAEAALGRAQHPGQAHPVGRVGHHPQVGEQVAHLGALVEPGAADHLVGDAAAHQLSSIARLWALVR